MKLTERDIIERIRKLCPATGEKLVKGIGDDCAVIGIGNGVLELITTDTLIENVHFGDWHPPELLGRKSAAVNLSDVAAMGGVPKYCLLSLALSDGVNEAWLDGVISGFLDMLLTHSVELVGGDTVRSPDATMLSVTVIGHVDENKLLQRSGAEAGDMVMVSGNLGDAAAGLELCRIGKAGLANENWPETMKAHLDPDPEIELGIILAQTGLVTAMMDMSDGLATDLAHICEASGCGAEVDKKLLPISDDLNKAAGELGGDAEKLAISGGEDYRLLFTVPEAHAGGLVATVKKKTQRDVFKVGRIVDGRGVSLIDGQDRFEVSFQGYDHFG